jgi:flagellar hook-associated protein 3 FlgL
MRVNPNQRADLLANLARSLQQQNTDLLELSSGRRVNTPSDDPASAAQYIENLAQTAQADSFQSAANSINGQLQTADSTLSSVVTALQRAMTLGIEGANGTLSDSNRAAITTELQGIQNQLVSLANTSYQGQYIFSGTVQTQPYAADPTAASGVRYDGNNGVNSVTIGTGYPLQVNLPGSQLFSSPSGDVFLAMHDLIAAMTSNTNIQSAVAEVSNAYNFVTAQRVFYGNGMNQITSQNTFLDSQKTQLASQQNTLVAADLASVATDLATTETARTAALTAIGQAPRTSLFDYLA